MSQLTPEQAEATLAEKLVKPIDELSSISVGVVAEAAEAIAKAKAEAAAKALENAQAALARVAALKAANVAAATVPAISTPLTVQEAAPVSTPPAAPSVQAPLVTADQQPATEIMERRSLEQRRSDQERRQPVSQEKARAEDTPERRAEARRMSLGRRADDPSGVHRMAESVRSASQALNADRLAVKHASAPKVPGRALEPIAHQAGLYAPRGNGNKRKIVTPKLILLFVLMVLFGMYATGNLPQFDQWTDSVVNAAHTHNDQIVNGMVSSWHIVAYIGAVLALLLMVFLIVNSIRARQSSDDL